MGLHLQVDHLGPGISFDEETNTISATGGASGIVYNGRYLDDNANSDQSATFIDADTNTNGAWQFSLRDDDHTAGMHYHIRVDVGTSSLQVTKEGTSTKTISGKFAGQMLSAVSSFNLLKDDGLVRIKPDGDNWKIY